MIFSKEWEKIGEMFVIFCQLKFVLCNLEYFKWSQFIATFIFSILIYNSSKMLLVFVCLFLFWDG